MNICLGGPWHGSKVLKCPSRKGWFSVKESSGNIITYEKREIRIGTRSFVCWIDSSLSFQQTNELIDKLSCSFRS